jgi:hypothetical protein
MRGDACAETGNISDIGSFDNDCRLRRVSIA